ncbi:retrotransposable element Tf2 [Tanacetum coccineum]
MLTTLVNTELAKNIENSWLTRKGKIIVGHNPELRKELLQYYHGGAVGGHSGVKTSISMDFIEGLPKSQGKNVIFVVVDRLSKYAHFIALSHPFTAHQVAQAFLGNFWTELFKLLQVQLLRSTSYHPRTDGQTEVVNRCLEGYLRCMTDEHPKEWAKWLSLAELWYNSNFHTTTQSTPFEIVYGIPLPIHVSYLGGLSKVEHVDRNLKAREEAILTVKFHLIRAQNRMKQQAYQRRTERSFEIGDWVLLKLQSHRQNGMLAAQPLTILDRKMVKKKNDVAIYGLVQWTNGNVEDATWEPLEKLSKDYPEFDLNS